MFILYIQLYSTKVSANNKTKKNNKKNTMKIAKYNDQTY